jgi:hypothetical protein
MLRHTLLLGLGMALLSVQATGCSSSPSGPSGSKAADTPSTPTSVVTPFGLASSACVAEVADNGIVTASDLAPCPAPILPAQQNPPPATDAATNPAGLEGDAGDDAGSEAGDDAASVPEPIGPQVTVNGWVEYADWTAAETPGRLATTWHVPDLPAEDNGQTIFYFPSYEPANGAAIVQPVLQYGVSAAGGGKYWAIASWWVGAAGARHSSLLQVNPGDTIRGTITASNCDSNGGCRFVIVTRDETLDNSRQLTVVESVPYTWVQAGVLEVYGVADCSQFPPEAVTFSSFVFDDQDGSPLTPAWNPEYVTPFHNCNYQVTQSPGATAIALGI